MKSKIGIELCEIITVIIQALQMTSCPSREYTSHWKHFVIPCIDNKRITATHNAREIKDIGYYADDARSFFQNRPALIGKEAIVEFLRSDLLVASSNKISFKTDEVFVSNDGNQVLEVGYFKVVDSTNTTINKGNYMSLFEKRNGKYVCVRDMSASDIQLPDQ